MEQATWLLYDLEGFKVAKVTVNPLGIRVLVLECVQAQGCPDCGREHALQAVVLSADRQRSDGKSRILRTASTKVSFSPTHSAPPVMMSRAVAMMPSYGPSPGRMSGPLSPVRSPCSPSSSGAVAHAERREKPRSSLLRPHGTGHRR